MTTVSAEDRERATECADELISESHPYGLKNLARCYLDTLATNAVLEERVKTLSKFLEDLTATVKSDTGCADNTWDVADYIREAANQKETSVDPINAIPSARTDDNTAPPRYVPKVGELAKLTSSPDPEDGIAIGKVWLISGVDSGRCDDMARWHYVVHTEPGKGLRCIHRGATWEPVEAKAEPDTKPREPGCKCQWEEGDSPCPVHGEAEAKAEPPTTKGVASDPRQFSTTAEALACLREAVAEGCHQEHGAHDAIAYLDGRLVADPPPEAATEWRLYSRAPVEARPYVPGEALSDIVSISAFDRENGSPKGGDVIARNPANHQDTWLVAESYFVANYRPEAEYRAELEREISLVFEQGKRVGGRRSAAELPPEAAAGEPSEGVTLTTRMFALFAAPAPAPDVGKDQGQTGQKGRTEWRTQRIRWCSPHRRQ